MSQTLNQLKSGSLKGIVRLSLSCELKEFPMEILSLADSLEILDLSNNQLSELPLEISQLHKLKVIFLSNNQFVKFPKVLKNCPELSMISFKSNQLRSIAEHVFPKKLRWLILTDNKIKQLPKSIGKCILLQKFAIAGNQLTELPKEMSNCINLELLRISANQLEYFPDWLFCLPKLSWLAIAGNPASFSIPLTKNLTSYDWSDFEIQTLLGEGASGIISKAYWKSKNIEVAIKVFKGELTSDGFPKNELDACIAIAEHNNLVKMLACVKNHPEKKDALIMGLIPSSYKNLGNPPSLETCSRDVFSLKNVYSAKQIHKIATSIASVCCQLHKNGINHGDLYAHNILVDENANCILGDYGAAFFYDKNHGSTYNIERIEIKAFACLMEDLESIAITSSLSIEFTQKWHQIINLCSNPIVKNRIGFQDLIEQLKRVETH